MSAIIPLSEPSITVRDYFEVFISLRSGWLTHMGSQCSKMKNIIKTAIQPGDIPQKLDVSVCSNGTTALHLALLALGVGPGDEVIVPNFGYIAAVNSVLMVGATPVLVDTASTADWTVSVASVSKSVTNSTKAIIAIDNYGMACDYESLRSVLRPEIKIIQDAAESFPGNNFGKGFKIQGDIATISFYANKIITSGEGGAVIGPSDLISKIDRLKSQNTESNGSFSHLGLGFNYRITNLQAAVFVAQWAKLRKNLKCRKEIFNSYKYNLRNQTKIVADNFNSSPWLATIRVSLSKEERDHLRKVMAIAGIETRSGFTPASKHSYVMEHARVYTELDNSIQAADQIICIPTFVKLKPRQISYITGHLNSALDDFNNK